MQEKRNSIANALELRLSFTNPFIYAANLLGGQDPIQNHVRLCPTCLPSDYNVIDSSDPFWPQGKVDV